MMRGPPDLVLDRARVREVAGIFHSVDPLETAGEDLLLAGFDRSDVDVIAPPDVVSRKLGAASIAIPAEDLADVPGVPREPFFSDDDVDTMKVVVVSTLGSIAAVFTALVLFLSGQSPVLTATAAVLLGGVVGGVAYMVLQRRLGRLKYRGIEQLVGARGVIVWVRVHSDAQEMRARDVLLAHGARAVRVHEIEVTKTTDDLPLGNLRPDPWLGAERLGRP